MSIIHFPAIVEGGDKPGFGVFFPDLPGCVSAGETVQAAATNAEIALGLHLAGMIEDGETIPDPTPLDLIAADRDVKEVARVLVRGEIAERAVRVNVTLNALVLALLDALAAKQSLDRSSMIAALVREAGLRESASVGDEWPELVRTYKHLMDTNSAEASKFWTRTLEPATRIGRVGSKRDPGPSPKRRSRAR